MGDSHALRGVIVTINTGVSAKVDSRHISLLLIFLPEIKIAFSFQLPLEFSVQTNSSSLVLKYTTFWFLCWLQCWCLSIRVADCCKVFFKTKEFKICMKTNWIVESHLLLLLLIAIPPDSRERCCLLQELFWYFFKTLLKV